MRYTVPCLVGTVALAACLCEPLAAASVGRNSTVVFATCVASQAEERDAELLIKSIRRFGGPLADAPIYVAVDDLAALPCDSLKALGAQLIPLEGDAEGRRYLFGQKVYAAAQVERMVASTARTLIWVDSNILVLAPPRPLELDGDLAVALRPVYLVNNVGLAPDIPIDPFWSKIYELVGVAPEKAPVVTTVVDAKQVRAYYNCGLISYRPSLGLCQEWARVFTQLVQDKGFQRSSCADPQHRVFLHQAVVSALIVARTSPEQRRPLPPECGYPLNLHDSLPAGRRATSLSGLTCAIVEQVWEEHPDWRKYIAADRELGEWLDRQLDQRLRVTDRIFREERSCNSYLFITPVGSAVVDPGGADTPDSRLLAMTRTAPLKAILLTHGHEDHRGGIALWRANREIPVIGQRELVEYLRYRDRLSGFFARRDAVFAGKDPEVPAAGRQTPVEVTVLFADSTSTTVGDLHFELVHTGGETPDTSLIWIPELKAVLIGDNFYDSFPNLYTLRGTKPRWALDYVAALDKALALAPDVLLPGHGEPILGAPQIRQSLIEYRDAILAVHDATVAGMNEGKDVFTLMREIALPADSPIGQSYGRVSWSVRGIFEGYAGWFDENPATMYAAPPSSIYPEIVRLAGGVDAIVGRARELASSGEHVQALHLTDVVLTADPVNMAALGARLSVLKSLRAESRNYIERRWLDDGIRRTQQRLAEAAPKPAP